MGFNAASLPLYWSGNYQLRGAGYLAGEPPATSDPDDPDGRARIINVPSRVRVEAYERAGMQCITQTVSAPDGTWRILGVSPDIDLVVIGFNDTGATNAAVQDWIRAAALPAYSRVFSARGRMGPGSVGVTYEGGFYTVNGTGAVTWTVSAGALPPGVTQVAGTGWFTGSPTTAGRYAFTLTAMDAASNTIDVPVVVDISREHLGIMWSQRSSWAADLVANETNMRDGLTTTGAGTQNTASEWIRADLGGVRAVDRVILGGGNLASFGGPVAPWLNGALLQYSADGLVWQDLLTVSGITDAGGNREFYFNAVSARYWQIFRPGYLATTNFQLFGPG